MRGNVNPLTEVLLAASLLSRLAAAGGPFQYCCDIAKCQRVVAACSNSNETIDGSTCEEACGDQLSCAPDKFLESKDYSCFQDFLKNDSSSPAKLICNQNYAPGLAAAPLLRITYDFCASQCSGWKRSERDKPNQWAAPLLQYVLPAVVFSMTIPRRKKVEVADSLFDFTLDRLNQLPKIAFSVVIVGVLVTIDISLWVFEIFAAAGPMLVGGLHEAVLDYRIVNHLDDAEVSSGSSRKVRQLQPAQKAELLLAVLSGNLDRNRGDPEYVLRRAIGLEDLEKPGTIKGRKLSAALLRMLNMLSSQYSFGSVVGAAVLFYIGSFIYQVSGLSSNLGDNDTSHALAFGMFWMTVVHVAIVSGCLLASNNPSTVTAVVADQIADEYGHLPRRHMKLGDWFKNFGRSSVYSSVFEPVPLFDRGVMKKCWIESTDVWTSEDGEWFRKKIAIRGFGFVILAIVSWLLVFIPCMLAFIVSYYTPRVCVSCRSLTFTIYSVSQLVLIAITAWRNHSYHEVPGRPPIDHFFRDIKWEFRRLRSKTSIGAGIYFFALFITFGAIVGALFTAVAGTLMQIVGVYRNCRCNIPISTWMNPGPQLFSISSDTQIERDSSKYWMACGIGAIGFMGTVCYIGWWYQRFLRRLFEERVDGLAKH